MAKVKNVVIELMEDFEREHGREPTDEEVEELFLEWQIAQYDSKMDC